MNSGEIINDLVNLEIKGRHRFWYPFMKKYNCRKICEVGVRRGKNFRRMIDHKPELAVAVDCWLDDGVKPRNDIFLSQNELDQQYIDFRNWMEKFPFVKICRGYSFDVVKEFPDEYFDFVYIDADHTYEGCLRDIIDWYPKVKRGGFLIGDDYRVKSIQGVKFGVIEAVNEFTRKNKLGFFLGMARKNWGVVKP